MSESRETAKRQNEEAEKKLKPLPGEDELVGRDELVDTAAMQLAASKLLKISLENQRIGNGHKPSHVIPSNPPEQDGAYEVTEDRETFGFYTAKKGERFRTYEQQEAICTSAIGEIFARVRDQGLDEKKVVEETNKKVKESLELQKRRRETEASTPPSER